MTELLPHHLVRIQSFMKERAGVVISDDKLPTVQSRLLRRLEAKGFSDFKAYLHFAFDDPAESEAMIDLLTTHETYFFREDHHLDLVRAYVKQRPGADIRVWSAACSSGQEAYSVAMVLADELSYHRPWTVFGSDVSHGVVEEARRGVYRMHRLDHVPRQLLVAHCQEGRGNSAGYLRIRPELRDRVTFERINLMERLPDMEPFDVIFLRNVLIYFTLEDQMRVIRSVNRLLKPTGMLLLGKAELLRGTPCPGLRRDGPSTWRKGP